MEDNAPDLTAKVATAWSDFTAALAVALPALPVGADLALILDPTTSGTGNAVYDVSVTVPTTDQIRADATSNATLPGTAQLGRRAVGQLVALGWQPPGVMEDAVDRFALSSTIEEAESLANIVSRTMRDVYGAPHPAFLTYDYRDNREDGDTELLLPPARRMTPPSEVAEASPVSAEPVDSGPLAEVVATVVAAMQHTTPAHLAIDDNGEISVRAGSAMVFIKPAERPAIVDVYSPLLTEVAPNERLYRELSELTRRLPIGRLYYSDGTIWASVPVYGRDFQPRHLMLAVESMTRLADELDDRLQLKFGGRRFFDQKAIGETSEDPPPTGMYL
ncbi:MAG: T3SS (YopN, CesT) and YbjN peptide-binding chaperone 1 [Stackebrandtia sp.]